MTSIKPTVGQFVRPGSAWSNRPWCQVTEIGDDPKWGPYFVAEYPATCCSPVTPYRQYASDHNFRFCEVSDTDE